MQDWYEFLMEAIGQGHGARFQGRWSQTNTVRPESKGIWLQVHGHSSSKVIFPKRRHRSRMISLKSKSVRPSVNHDL